MMSMSIFHRFQQTFKFGPPAMSISVNCWFCSEDSLVPVKSRDSWECPKCDQFNSFTSDGDVVVPPAAGAAHRSVRYNMAVQPPTAPRWQLCYRCNLHQQLKAHQLAAFRPVVEEQWEVELDEYRQHLERVYDPCVHCKAVVASALRETDDRLRPAWLTWLRQQQQQQPPEATPLAGLAGTRARSGMSTAWNMMCSGAMKCGSMVHICAMKAGSVLWRCATLVQTASLLLLLLLLCNSCLLGLSRTLVPAEYLHIFVDLEDAFVENRPTLVFFCFTLWVLIAELNFKVQTLLPLLLWVSVCIAEMCAGDHIAGSTAALLQTALVLGLLCFPHRKLLGHIRTTGRSDQAGNLSPGPVPSSTPKTSPYGATGRHSPALSNGHLSQWPAGRVGPASNGLPSPISPGQPSPSAQSPQTDYDYDLPRLSLGSPRRPARSGGVFALRTYQPASGGALFSGDSRPAPLLSPARLRSQLHHSAWIAGGYWQRGQPAPTGPHPLLSRSSSQSSGFVDAWGAAAGPGSVLGDEEPRVWAGPQCDAASVVGSAVADWRSCSRSVAESAGRGCRWPVSPLDSSSHLSARSVASQRTTDGSVLTTAVSHRSLVMALVLGFSMAFNMFALLLLVYRDRL